jgi:hypothetical protein
MWELRVASPFGSLTKRNILTSFAAILVTCFVYIFVAAPTTHAAGAEWDNGIITYNGQQYTKLEDGSAGSSPTLPQGEKYVYNEIPLSGAATGLQKAHIIYFAPGVDPPKATSASLVTYTLVPPNAYSSPSAATKIAITPEPVASKGTSSCDGVKFGIGYVICPVTNFLADGMDWLFGILSSFLVVRPVQTSQETALYRAWGYMRNFANVAFVIAFLIIIYSQVSSLGISNFGIKKLLPRLIIAAILVNISYWICAIAVDLSNIAGYSIQDLFIGMRNTLVGAEGNGWDVVSWKSVGSFVLSGGAAVGGLAIAGHAFAAGAGGGIYMLLPVLLGVLLAVLVALLVMAARQALITILIIVAPLAFVAYLLPNTEKFFDKWRELFTTMLIMFPIFSIIFGGSQLAGIAIIQNADSIHLIILGMAVQVAPVVVTPMLVKFSGSLLGRIAGMVNNPNKGLIDRTRKWSQERADLHKAKRLGNPDNKYNKMGSMARGIERKRRAREDWKKTYDAMADNEHHNSSEYAAIDKANREVGRRKQLIDNHHEEAWNRSVRTNAASLEKELQVRVTGDKATAAKAQLDAIHEELKTGNVPLSGQMGQWAQLSIDSQMSAQDIALTAMRKQSAEKLQSSQHANALLQNTATIDGTTLQEYAGGVRGTQGADSALASAVAAERKAYGEALAESAQVIKHFNLGVDERQSLVMDKNLLDETKPASIIKTDSHGNVREFTVADTFAREAAIELQIKEGPVKDAIEIVKHSGSDLANFKTTIASAAAEAKLGSKTSFVGGTTMDMIATGAIDSPERWTGVVQDNIAKGKISPDVLVSIDVDAVTEYVRAAEIAVKTGNVDNMTKDKDTRDAYASQFQAFKKHARTALDPNNPQYSGRVKDNVRRQLERLLALDDLPPDFDSSIKP